VGTLIKYCLSWGHTTISKQAGVKHPYLVLQINIDDQLLSFIQHPLNTTLCAGGNGLPLPAIGIASAMCMTFATLLYCRFINLVIDDKSINVNQKEPYTNYCIVVNKLMQ